MKKWKSSEYSLDMKNKSLIGQLIDLFTSKKVIQPNIVILYGYWTTDPLPFCFLSFYDGWVQVIV